MAGDWCNSTSASVTSDTIWYHWNCVTTANSADTTWAIWNADTTASITTTVTAWTAWNDQYSIVEGGAWIPREQTEEEKAAAKARADKYAAKEAERQKRQAEAKERAIALLYEHLDKKQREELERDRFFTVESKTSKRRYRVKAGSRHGNIKEVDAEGREIRSICCAPEGNIPEEDALLGQKLFLEHDEEAFLRTANITELQQRAG